jgi:hypothetical protein
MARSQKRARTSFPLEFIPPSCRNATKRDVANFFGVSTRTVDTWVRDHKIPYLKLSPRMLRFDLSAVAKSLDRFVVEEVK